MSQYSGKATIYLWHFLGWGFARTEVKELIYGDEPTGVQYVKKGSRSQETQRCNDPLVVLEGWGHPDMNLFGEPHWIGNSCSKEYLYGSGDPRWERDFDEFLSKYLSETGSEVIVDYRSYYEKKRNSPKPEVPEDNSDPFAEDDSNQQQTIGMSDLLSEGGISQALVNEYERNPEARRRCLEHYGATCVVCNFNFLEFYGEAAQNTIHVHHLRPLAEIRHEYEIDPIMDLRPVCPNCHAVIHKKIPSYTVEEVRFMISLKGSVQ